MATRAQQQAVTGTLDIASGLLQATPSVLSLVIYLMNVLLPRLQQAFANRPLLRKVLSVALPGGLAASLVFKVLNRLWDSFIWKKFLYWTTSVGYVESGDILNWAIWHQMHTTKKVMNHNTYTFCSRSFFRNRFTSDDVDAEHVHCGKSTDLTRVPFDQHYVFWHGGRLFCTTFDKEKYRREIRCLGWSTGPLQEYLDKAYLAYKTANELHAIQLYVSQGSYWSECIAAPVRFLETVELSSLDKQSLVADIDKFLTGKEWYKQRNIPWRRGYLFHGHPGTGKSSMVTALAVHFKLPVYSISLSSGMDDRMLKTLFRGLNGSNTIILLEDIDSTGLMREFGADQSEPQKKADKGKGEEKKEEKAKETAKGTRVTLSGLLNAMDESLLHNNCPGVGAPEGQVLIMTSNHSDRLDPALTRPGRIDYRLNFDLATKEQAAGIFLRLQAATHGKPERRTELFKLAATFASKIPDKVVSPAEIQEFLLHHRDEPECALEDVDDWIAEKVAIREAAEHKGASDKTASTGKDNTSRRLFGFFTGS